MTPEDTIRMAREAGLISRYECRETASDEMLERFFRPAYEAGAAAEREACAQVCEAEYEGYDWADRERDGAEACAAAIRARGDK